MLGDVDVVEVDYGVDIGECVWIEFVVFGILV